MVDRTKATSDELTPATASTSGVLRPEELARHVDLQRWAPRAEAAPWVENHWSLRWTLPTGRIFTSQVVPHPTVALTVELASHPRPDVPTGHAVVVTGVVTKRFDVEVQGDGRVVGVRFRPGGLTALTGQPAATWRDTVVPAVDVLAPSVCARLGDPDLAADGPAWATEAETALLAIGRDADPHYEELLVVLADMLDDRSLLTAAEVAQRHGLALRSLQRRFTHYVGVGPKWVLARYRMLDVVSDLHDGYDGTLTDLAHRYGWYDQAHFTRDFTALVGTPPGQYRGQ